MGVSAGDGAEISAHEGMKVLRVSEVTQGQQRQLRQGERRGPRLTSGDPHLGGRLGREQVMSHGARERVPHATQLHPG